MATSEAVPNASSEPTDNNNNENENKNDDEENRDAWSGRVTFWLAAVGSAVGLGNLWRFPYQCATWGGGAFIFAYFVALMTLGMPLLTQELAIGQKHRSGDIEAFGRMNWRLRGIGLVSVIAAFGIVTYYMMIIGLSTVFFFESFMAPLPYAGDAGSSYWTEILQLAPGPEESEGIIAGKLYLATCLCWFLTFLCIMKGVKSASWAVKITMPLPFLLLFILLIKGATLEGSWRGIKEYWNFSNWDELSTPGIWNAAIGQCFFSLSVCMGVMTAYGSYNPIKQDIATDEKVIAFLDIFASLMSGFVVYSVLGHLVVTTGDESWFETKSTGLVFAAYPVAIATFDGANFFGITFYLTLVLLGIDSAFSMVEAICTVIDDSDLNLYKLKWSRTKIAAVICVVGAFGSSLYTFDTGLYWLDIVDHYINNYGMIFLGICETAACGWFYRYDIIESKIGVNSANLYRLGFFISLFMAIFLSYSLATPEWSDSDGKYIFTGTLGGDSWAVGFCVGLILWGITILWSYSNRNDYARENLTLGQTMWYILGWENVEVLRDFMNINGFGAIPWNHNRHTLYGEFYAGLHHSSIGIWWGFFIKYWIPVVLSVVLVGTMRDNRWNPYEGYEWSSLSVGVIIFSLMVLCVGLIAIFPHWMTQSVDKSNVYQNIDIKVKEEDNIKTPSTKEQMQQSIVVEEEEEQQQTRKVYGSVGGSNDIELAEVKNNDDNKNDTEQQQDTRYEDKKESEPEPKAEPEAKPEPEPEPEPEPRKEEEETNDNDNKQENEKEKEKKEENNDDYHE